MPWQEMQFLNMTCLTGPVGGSTCGRVGFSRNCAATGATPQTEAAAMTAATDHRATPLRLHFIGGSPSPGRPLTTREETTYNAETTERAEKMLTVFLRVLRVLR